MNQYLSSSRRVDGSLQICPHCGRTPENEIAKKIGDVLVGICKVIGYIIVGIFIIAAIFLGLWMFIGFLKFLFGDND